MGSDSPTTISHFFKFQSSCFSDTLLSSGKERKEIASMELGIKERDTVHLARSEIMALPTHMDAKAKIEIVSSPGLVQLAPSPKGSESDPDIIELQDKIAALADVGRSNILDLPPEILEYLCDQYLDTCSSTCLGLTCKAFFNITEHLHPYQVSLYTRTLPTRKCLGQLLATWMPSQYIFDHSWGKFTLRRYHLKGHEEIVARKWKEKESWPRIRLVMDGMGAVLAYRAERTGFEDMAAIRRRLHRLRYQ